MAIRYILSKDCSYFYDVNKTKIYLDHKKEPFYVDILSEMQVEGICLPVKIKVFCPNGEIIIGYVSGQYITINNKDELYDGRFNSDSICK